MVGRAGVAAGSEVLIIWGAGVSFAALPPAIGAAVLRYRLYDEVLAVAEQTMEPTMLSLWLRPPSARYHNTSASPADASASR